MLTQKESPRPIHFRLNSRVGPNFAQIALIMCVLTTHIRAAEQVPFVYHNPYLLVTEGLATVTDPAGNRKTVEATTVEDTKADRKIILPGVVVLSGGETVETAEKSVASLLSPTSGTVMASGHTAFRLSSGALSPKSGDEKRHAGISTSLEMLKGTLWFTINGEGLRKSDQSPEFRLRTPKNILAVKGTEFSVSHSDVFDRATGKPAVKTGVKMEKGVVELRTAEGKTQANLDAKNMASTIYMLDADGGIADVFVLGSSKSNEAAEEAKVPSFQIGSNSYNESYYAQAEPSRRKITLEANERGSNRPRREPKYATLGEADEEGVLSLSYRRPDRGPQPEELVVRIRMTDQSERHVGTYGVLSHGLLIRMQTSSKVETRLDGSLIIRDRSLNKDVIARVGLNEPGWKMGLGEAKGWQAAYVPLNSGFPAGENEDDEDESCLKISFKTPPELAEFQIGFSPIFMTKGARPTQ